MAKQPGARLDRAWRSGYLGQVREARLAAMIEDLTRRLTAAVPAPRGLPYLGLERPSGSGVQLLEALSTHGIFRKYELVLDLGGGLGATARWLAGRLACTAVATTDSPEVAAGGRTLTRRAALHGQVLVCAHGPAVAEHRADRMAVGGEILRQVTRGCPRAVLAKIAS